ncbi:MAG: P-loop NTPase fold protein [Candidatus Electrothrix communis]|nr:MAG: P-loop NTPase fold protein [Candidatus Electrothrix communis]
MTLLNQHVTEYLNYYSKLKTSPGYAVLLKGKWGCGKTWFIKKYRDEINDDCEGKQKNRCKCLYVSLYGVTSYGEIEHIFFQQLHPVLSSKGMAITGKILKGLIKTSIKIDIDGDGKSDGSVGSQIPDLNLPEEFLNTDDSILIFDDLERCGINQEDILGYINYFVEYQGLKVIIIANEEAIIDKEKYIVENDSTAVSYKEKKEKIVGKTLEIKSDADSAIDNFINDIDNESLRSSIKDKKSLILDIYSGSSYDNLRHLKQGILDYARLVSSFDNDVQNNTEFISHFIKVFFPLYFEIRSGKFNAEDIKDVNCILANYRNENNEMVNLNKSLKNIITKNHLICFFP